MSNLILIEVPQEADLSRAESKTEDYERLLEQGAVLLFPSGRLPLPPEEDLEFLRDELAKGMTLKNISYHPHGGYLSGLKGDAQARTKTILHAHNQVVTDFLGGVFPNYSSAWSLGKVNYRPLQAEGRELSRHSSNELLHVDAFASGATHGGRTLRFFTNINPTQSRKWKSAGLFPELLEQYGLAAGVLPLGRRGLREGPLGISLSYLLKGIAKLGLPQALTVDTSPYDRAMKRMHDTLKDDEEFQADKARCSYLEFPPFSSWVCLTDMVSHACVSGQHALVNTWTVPKSVMRAPELAPYALISGA
ncbi:MAG: hypothetical protein ACI9K5_003412 [Gammaproteobacteria bacterium]|jgi:hypothetical protein